MVLELLNEIWNATCFRVFPTIPNVIALKDILCFWSDECGHIIKQLCVSYNEQPPCQMPYEFWMIKCTALCFWKKLFFSTPTFACCVLCRPSLKLPVAPEHWSISGNISNGKIHYYPAGTLYVSFINLHPRSQNCTIKKHIILFLTWDSWYSCIHSLLFQLV